MAPLPQKRQDVELLAAERRRERLAADADLPAQEVHRPALAVLFDLGPDGGADGGEILFAGTPEELAKADTATSAFMREELERSREAVTDIRLSQLDLDEMRGDEDEPEEEITEELEDEAAEADA